MEQQQFSHPPLLSVFNSGYLKLCQQLKTNNYVHKPGWYPYNNNPNDMRWWDGNQWTISAAEYHTQSNMNQPQVVSSVSRLTKRFNPPWRGSRESHLIMGIVCIMSTIPAALYFLLIASAPGSHISNLLLAAMLFLNQLLCSIYSFWGFHRISRKQAEARAKHAASVTPPLT